MARKWGVVVASIVGVASLVFGIAIVLYLISGETAGSGRGIVHRMAHLIPLQSLKIIIVAWQIVTQVRKANERLVLGEELFGPILCSSASKYCTYPK